MIFLDSWGLREGEKGKKPKNGIRGGLCISERKNRGNKGKRTSSSPKMDCVPEGR